MHPQQKRLRDRRLSASAPHEEAPQSIRPNPEGAPAELEQLEREPPTDPNASEIPPLPDVAPPAPPLTFASEFEQGQIAGLLHEASSLLQMAADMCKVMGEAQGRHHVPIAGLAFAESLKAAASEFLKPIIEAHRNAPTAPEALPTIQEIFAALAALPAPWENASPVARIREAAARLNLDGAPYRNPEHGPNNPHPPQPEE